MTKKRKRLPQLLPSAELMDSHCHLDMDSYAEDLDTVLETAAKSGVTSVITIGIDITSSRKAVEIAKTYDMVHAAVGIHPHDSGQADDAVYQQFITLIETAPSHIVGYGEIGLDYVKNYAPKKTQQKVFRDQLEIAKKFNLPVIIHDREAHDDTLTILKEAGPFPRGGIMHCFSGDMEYADKVLDLGFHISIPGIVTFKNAHELKKVAANAPLERLLLETDGPFLAPTPYRGKRNQPLFLLYTAEQVAELREISLEELAQATTENGKNLFSLT